MNIIFAGTPDFAVPALTALVSSGHQVSLVLTQPDRPAGRGLRLHASAVKTAALSFHIPVLQPARLNTDDILAQLQQQQADLMIVAAYGIILPQAVLDIPRYGCINIHASLLPRWRGAAPIQRAILAGDRESGVTLMQMAAGLDTGDMLARRSGPITDTTTAGGLTQQLADIGGRLLVEALAQWPNWPLAAEPQDETQVTYAAKIDKSEARIDWQQPAAIIARHIRAFDPFPGAFTTESCGSTASAAATTATATEHAVPEQNSAARTIKIWQAQVAEAGDSNTSPTRKNVAAGKILACEPSGILVQCGQGCLKVTQLQRAGGRRLSAEAFIAGQRLTVGDRWL